MGNDTPAGRGFDGFVQFLIFYSVGTVVVETLPGWAERGGDFFLWSERVVVAIFTVEYVLRVWLSEKKLKFMLSPFGLVDLAAILPFYLGAGDLRILRLLRTLRLFRLFKLARYSKAIQLMGEAIHKVRYELVSFFYIVAVVVLLASAGIYTFENAAQPEAFPSIPHSFWWAIVTLTTVGYGDVFPITLGGKVFASVVMLTGIGVIAVPTGLISSSMMDLIRNRND
jgi:voltage-gated potassium channel